MLFPRDCQEECIHYQEVELLENVKKVLDHCGCSSSHLRSSHPLERELSVYNVGPIIQEMEVGHWLAVEG
jgi:hypothetical protein